MLRVLSMVNLLGTLQSVWLTLGVIRSDASSSRTPSPKLTHVDPLNQSWPILQAIQANFVTGPFTTIQTFVVVAVHEEDPWRVCCVVLGWHSLEEKKEKTLHTRLLRPTN